MAEFQDCTLHYYQNLAPNRPESGRGEPVRLLLEDAGIKHTYERIPFDKWPAIKQSKIDGGDRSILLPFITTKSGKLYSRVSPLLRRVSKSVGKYIPSNADDEYLVDTYSDETLDWRVKWVEVYFDSSAKVQESYKKELETQYTRWNGILGDRNGPYTLGQEISYVDFELYGMLREDQELKQNIKNQPNVVKFVEAIEARAGLQHLFSTEYSKVL